MENQNNQNDKPADGYVQAPQQEAKSVLAELAEFVSRKKVAEQNVAAPAVEAKQDAQQNAEKERNTAGTGSEVTAFSVITDTSRNYKLTVFSYELLPKYALLDPEMIMSVPPMVAASCGIDALIHAWEAYTSLGASPFSDAMAEKAMELIGGNIRRFVANRKDEEAACAMMSGSMFAGIAFAWARLGDVHAMSHPVSAFFGVQHGVANSILLPVIVEYNALADHGRYEKIYNYISEEKEPVKDFKPEMLVEEIKKLNASLGIPKTLSEVGVTEDKIPQMAADAMKSGNIAANPRQTTLKDVEMLYRKAL